MSKILHIRSGKKLGGVTTVYINYNKLLEHLGHDITCVLRPGAEFSSHINTKKEYLNYIRIDLPFFRNIASKKLASVIERNNPKYIIVHKPIDAYLCRLAAPEANIALVIHGFQKKYLEYATTLIAISEPVLAHLKLLGCKNLHLITNFLNSVPIDFKSKWYNPLRFGALGTFRSKKGFVNWLKSTALLDKSKIYNYEAHLCGNGPQKPLLHLMKKYYHLDRLQIHNWQLNPLEWMKNIDVIIVPSNFETFSMVIIEAMSLGILVIATQTDGPSSIIEDGKTGILVPTNNPQALCDAMISVIQQPQKWDEVRMNARKMVSEKYLIEQAAEKMKCVLN